MDQGRPQIFNTDQEVQFTTRAFTHRLKAAEIQVSMASRGGALDNVLIECL